MSNKSSKDEKKTAAVQQQSHRPCVTRNSQMPEALERDIRSGYESLNPTQQKELIEITQLRFSKWFKEKLESGDFKADFNNGGRSFSVPASRYPESLMASAETAVETFFTGVSGRRRMIQSETGYPGPSTRKWSLDSELRFNSRSADDYGLPDVTPDPSDEEVFLEDGNAKKSTKDTDGKTRR